jgi:tRNA modification GTPase
MKEGASVVLCGRPNVGKSSLMNALLRHDRVIVTPVAGTTRDIVEESIDISGMLVRLSDTAGMIETTDRVEIEGIKRSKEKLAASDIVILVLDAGRPVEPRDIEIFETVKDKDLIVAANKCDLEKRMDLRAAAERFGRQPIEVSALKREGLEELEDVISEILLGGRGSAEEIPLLTNTRHKRLMAEAEKHLLRALGTARTSFNEELLALDLKQAMESLDAITGRMVADDVLDNIFSNFCIGK